MSNLTTLICSDIHLSPQRPDIGERFHKVISNLATDSVRLIIIGDLFDFWIGDDCANMLGHGVHIAKLAELPCEHLVMHGNRDFLLGNDFANRTGSKLIEDPTVITAFGHPIVLSHGDVLCSDDTEHQQFRTLTRDPEWKEKFLGLPAQQRLELAQEIRSKSRGSDPDYPAGMRIDGDRVTGSLIRQNSSVFVHGHIHRPGVHHFEVNGKSCVRIVLGDWDKDVSYLLVDESGLTLKGEATVGWSELAAAGTH